MQCFWDRHMHAFLTLLPQTSTAVKLTCEKMEAATALEILKWHAMLFFHKWLQQTSLIVQENFIFPNKLGPSPDAMN